MWNGFHIIYIIPQDAPAEYKNTNVERVSQNRINQTGGRGIYGCGHNKEERL